MIQADTYYRAMLAKDRRFDGTFFVAVHTTKIYCRPICPARKPLRKNVTFYPSAAAAEEAGYRPCLRCRPETSPGTPAWRGSSAVVARALRLIAAGVVEREGMEGLILRSGIGERQLRRLFVQHLGAAPHDIVRVRRLDFAQRLLDDTAMSVTQVAFASGFGSVRSFNHAFRERFGRSPTERRKRSDKTTEPSLAVKLPFRPPYDWASLIEFFSARSIPGVERIRNGVYERTVDLGQSRGYLRAELEPDKNRLELSLDLSNQERLMEMVNRARALFDTEADPLAISAQLGRDPVLKNGLRRFPGLRLPGCWSGFEAAVRAILGQQVSLSGARLFLQRLTQACGTPLSRDGKDDLTHLFPTAAQIAGSPLTDIGLTRARAETLRRLAIEVESGRLVLDGSEDIAQTKEKLLAIKGVGPWTAEYISLRALQDPDAFPESDLVLRREMKRVGSTGELWRPWRAYAAIHLWKAATSSKGGQHVLSRSIKHSSR